jgi:hypothetical protein
MVRKAAREDYKRAIEAIIGRSANNGSLQIDKLSESIGAERMNRTLLADEMSGN